MVINLEYIYISKNFYCLFIRSLRDTLKFTLPLPRKTIFSSFTGII